MEFKDYYKTLGVARDATQDTIKKAYRKLARRYHPDVSKEGDAEARFKDLGEAYEVLRDAEKRSAYDRFGSDWKAGQEFRPPPGWNGGAKPGERSFADDGSGFSEFFESLFGRGRGPGAATGFGNARQLRRGEDRHARIVISLEDAYHGNSRTLSLNAPQIDDSGRVSEHTRQLNVRIPAGITDGTTIRLAGQGSPGAGGTGDLYLKIDFAAHQLFSVDGRDITLELPVTPWEAALGGKVAVPTLGGVVDLSIPAGSQTGQRLRLRGRGLPASGQRGTAGDQYVSLRIVTPEAKTAADRDLYRQMAKQMPSNPRADMVD